MDIERQSNNPANVVAYLITENSKSQTVRLEPSGYTYQRE